MSQRDSPITVSTGYPTFKYHIEEVHGQDLAGFDEDVDDNFSDTMSLTSAVDDDQKPRHQSDLTQHEFTKWRRCALAISWCSLVFQISLGTISIGLGLKQNSSGTFGYGVNVIADMLSTIIIIWQYTGKAGSSFSWERERRATIVLSLLMMGMGIGVFIKAVYNLIHEIQEFEKWELFAVCDVSLLIYPALAAAKMIVAQKLRSSAFLIDAICSVVASVTAGGLLASLIIYWYFPVWYVDPIMGILIAIFMVAYAGRMLYTLIYPKKK